MNKLTEQIIKEVYIKDWLGIKQLTYTPQPGINKVEGENGAGKSSFMKALAVVFMSLEDAKQIINPVRNGQSMATVSAELTDMTITKTWNASGKSRIEVLSKDGARYPDPKKMIEGLIGQLPTDPTKLMNMTDKQIMELFISAIDTEEDFNDLEIQRKKAYDDRRVINRMKNDTKAKQEGYHLDYPNAPKEEQSISKLSKELTVAMAIVARHKQDMVLLDRANIEIKELEAKLELAKQGKADLETSIINFDDPHVRLIQEAIDNVEVINKQVRYMNEKHTMIAEYIKLKADSEEKTQQLQNIADTKEYVIKNANIPIDGISFDENGINFNGVPLSQCSTEEQLWVCLAITVFTHKPTEHGIKVMLLHHGNNLDSKNLEMVKDFCTKQGYQTWIEMVRDEPSGTGVFIEGGEIKNGA